MAISLPSVRRAILACRRRGEMPQPLLEFLPAGHSKGY